MRTRANQMSFRWNKGMEDTAQKMKFSINDFFSKCDQIRSFLRIWSHLLKKYLMENFIFCAVRVFINYFKFVFVFVMS